ncbi:hypothetical protein [Citromicrobium bathyomarinum]|uniref:hypothetical protein n=1 Tax=Citromicrobium bathyomarinum TaxID=72174 RepID=UPI003159DE1A
MIRLKCAMLSAAVLLCGVPANAEEPADGVEVENLWEFFGAISYAGCMVREIGSVSDDVEANTRAVKNARSACAKSPAKTFAKATMNGGAFPPVFAMQAEAMIPETDTYVIRTLAQIEPSPTPLDKRLQVMLRKPDGSLLTVAEDGEPLDIDGGDFVVLHPISSATYD